MEADREQRHTNNVLLFRLAISNSFKSIAESVSEDAFLECLTILKSKPSIAQKLHKAMFKELYENMNDDLEEILKEGSLQSGLERVAKLSDANTSMIEEAWRPPGNVSLHLRSLDAQMILKESESLEKRVTEMEEENAILMKKIAEKRSKIMDMNDSITRSLSRSPIALDSLEKRLQGLERCLTLLNHK